MTSANIARAKLNRKRSAAFDQKAKARATSPGL